MFVLIEGILFTRLHYCYMIGVAISEARVDQRAVFAIWRCSNSGMELILDYANVNKEGLRFTTQKQ